MKKTKMLFYALVFTLPLNLGKHFEGSYSYVWGLLVDYLIPTVYVQDILIFLILILWIFEKGTLSKIKKSLSNSKVKILILFLFSLFLSSLVSIRFIPSIYYLLRIYLYSGLFLYVLIEIDLKKEFDDIIALLASSVFLVSLLGIIQFLKQASLFDNYLFFGEQPYSLSTWGINKEGFLGNFFVPAYGLFRHPNIFGGLLSILIIWMVARINNYTIFKLYLPFYLLALAFTFSLTSFIALFLGILLLVASKKEHFMPVVIVTVFLLSTFSLFLPKDPQYFSLYRRSALVDASYKVIEKYPLFGLGPNNLTAVIDSYMDYSIGTRFTQPVHNIFLLLFSEGGFFALSFFLLFLFLCLKSSYTKNRIIFISIMQLIFIGSFDHYFLTIHQPLLFTFLILALSE